MVSKESDGNSLIFHCWPDRKETKLNKQLGRLLAMAWGQNRHRKDQARQLVQFMKSLYYSSSEKTILAINMILNAYRPDQQISYRSIYHAPPARPPEFA